jgi:hypothetical protein
LQSAPSTQTQPTKYSPEIAYPGEPEASCPPSTRGPRTQCIDGDEVLTREVEITILVGYGLPNLKLRSDKDFMKRSIVSAICNTFQAAHFKHDNNFLEMITVDGNLVSFHLGS